MDAVLVALPLSSLLWIVLFAAPRMVATLVLPAFETYAKELFLSTANVRLRPSTEANSNPSDVWHRAVAKQAVNSSWTFTSRNALD